MDHGSYRGLGLALLVTLAGCTAPVGDDFEAEDTDSTQLAATAPKLLANKSVGLWANLWKEREAHYRACENQPFLFTLTYRNKGSAVWRDVVGRGDKPGSDVFLETLDNKPDPLTGHKRYSLRNNANDWVRGDRKAGECTTRRGCRKTRAVRHGIHATAPGRPGKYWSKRYHLRDYSKAHNSPAGFGPRVRMRIHVVHCEPPAENCGCTVECSDGTSHKLWSAIEDDNMCKVVGEGYCKPASLVSHEFKQCTQPTTDAGSYPGGYAGAPGDEDLEDPPGGYVLEDDGDGSSGSGGTGSGGSGGGGSSWWWNGEEDDPGVGITPDSPDYEPDGFDGVAEEPDRGAVLESESGCSLSSPTRGSSWLVSRRAPRPGGVAAQATSKSNVKRRLHAGCAGTDPEPRARRPLLGLIAKVEVRRSAEGQRRDREGHVGTSEVRLDVVHVPLGAVSLAVRQIGTSAETRKSEVREAGEPHHADAGEHIARDRWPRRRSRLAGQHDRNLAVLLPLANGHCLVHRLASGRLETEDVLAGVDLERTARQRLRYAPLRPPAPGRPGPPSRLRALPTRRWACLAPRRSSRTSSPSGAKWGTRPGRTPAGLSAPPAARPRSCGAARIRMH